MITKKDREKWEKWAWQEWVKANCDFDEADRQEGKEQ